MPSCQGEKIKFTQSKIIFLTKKTYTPRTNLIPIVVCDELVFFAHTY